MTHTITGHIDGLRIHSSSIHVIDDKPNPNKEKPIAQDLVRLAEREKKSMAEVTRDILNE
jgi:hypothetical protein